jgi:acetolactate synthase-1/2/3 large subunit
MESESNLVSTITVAEEIVDSLIKEGVKFIFGITGDTILPLLDAIYQRQDEIKYITARGEMSAVAMADAYSRLTGEIGVCAFHVGPCVANSLLGVWTSQKDSVPVMVLSANMDRYRLGRNIWHEFDVMGVFSKVTKWNDQLVEAKDVRRLMRNGFQISKSGMPGPVHLDFPKDQFILPSTIETSDLSHYGASHSGFIANATRPDAEAVSKAAELLANAKNPIILAGRGVIWSKAGGELLELAERLAIPVATTETGRGCIPETHPLACGLLGHFGRAAANDLVREADVIVGLGSGFHNVNTINWQMISQNTKIIQVESDPEEIGHQYAVHMGVAADSGEFLKDVLSYCKEHDLKDELGVNHPRTAVIAEKKAAELGRFYDTDMTSTPIKPQLLTQVISEVAEDDAIYPIGSGYHTHFANYVAVNRPDQYLWPTGSGTLCYAFAAGIGAKLAFPDRQVIVPIGDGDFGMNCQDLELAVREKLGIVVIVYDDCSYGALRIFQKNQYEERYIGSHYGPTDFAKLAEAYGARGEKVENPDDFKPALERALASNECTVLQVAIDPWEQHCRAAEFGDFHKF